MPYIGQRPATGEHNSFKILDDISNYTLTFGSSDVDVSADTITAREHRFVTGQRVTYGNGGGTDPTGLSNGTVYYIIVEDRHTFKLATNASNAVAGTAINITGAGAGAAHTINVTFDGVNTKFKATHSNGTKADISQSGQLMVSVNGVLQQPHDNTTTPSTGYATDHTSTIIFSAAPAAGDQFFGRLIASNFATFDISDNTVDNFTGDGSTSTFTLSKTPPNNESILVTIDGVVQYPDDNAAVRAYTVSENILDFASAPGNAVEIQVRHIGFAGASTGGISGFYGRTGNAVLKNTDDIVFNNANVGVVTATDIRVTGNLTVDGTTTTLDTDLIGVDRIEVDANSTNPAVAVTQSGSGAAAYFNGGDVNVATGNIALASATPMVVASNGSGHLRLGAGGSEKVRIKSDGKVGIGTDNPDMTLHLYDSTAFAAFTNNGDTGESGILFRRHDNNHNRGKVTYNFTDDALIFRASSNGGGEDLRITSTGNIGIGENNPAAKLDVKASQSNTVDIRLRNTESNAQMSLYAFGGSAAIGSHFNNRIAMMSWNSTEGIDIITNGTGNNDFRVYTAGYGTNRERLRITSGGDFYLNRTSQLTDAKISIGADTGEALIAAQMGTNTGISTVLQTYNSNGNISSNISVDNANRSLILKGSNTEGIRITSAGNVGIGTAVPVTSGGYANLSLAKTNGGQVEFKKLSSGRTHYIWGDDNLNIGAAYNGSGDLIVKVNGNNERLRVTSSGSVGIGTDTPGTTKLKIETGSGTRAISLNAPTNGTYITFETAGTAYADIGAEKGVVGSGSADTPVINARGSRDISFRTNSSERLRITSAGKIGVGVVAPNQMMEITNTGSTGAQIQLRDTSTGTSAGDGVRFGYNGSGAQIWNFESTYIRFATSNVERLHITSAGLVGVNCTPLSQFQVKGGTNANIGLTIMGGEAAIEAFNDAGSANVPLRIRGTDIKFFTSSTERLRINSNGKVSLGCDFTAGATLHVRDSNNTTKGAAQLKISKGVGSNAAPTSISRADCYIHLGGSEWGAGGTGIYLMGLGYTNGETGSGIPAYIGYRETTSSGYTYGDLIFGTRGNTTGTSNPTERLRIDSQGRLGVGVTPKGFHANNKDVIQGSSGYVILGRGTSSLNISQNFYYDSSDAGKYIATGAATLYNQSNGSHTFYNASSGSADASASLVERFQIQSDGRVSIGAPAANALGALHIHANQGTDTALWIGDSSTNRYLAINEQGSSQNFTHINTRYNDNGIHAHYILDNPYANAAGYGSQILFRGYNNGTTAYIETSNEAASTARGTLRLRGADNHGLDVRSTGEVTTTHASNIGYATNAATNTRSLVYQSRDPQRQEPTGSNWYILKTFYPNKSGTVNMHAEMYIQSGPYYFNFRVREEGTNEIVFNAGDNGGYSAYATNGNAVHSYRIYKWVCPKIKAHKRYYIEMAATNAAGTAGPYTSVGQWLYLKNFSVYSMSGGHSDGTEAIQIGQSQDVSSATANSGTTHFYMSPGVNRESINVTQYFAGTESTFLGWFTSRAYNRYIDFELSMSGSYMWFAQAYGYLYSRGQVAGSMISGYTYSGNTILNKFSTTLGNRGWYGSYRTSSGNLCLKFDSGSNGYSEGRIALFFGTHGPTPPEWRVLQYRQNDTTNNIF